MNGYGMGLVTGSYLGNAEVRVGHVAGSFVRYLDFAFWVEFSQLSRGLLRRLWGTAEMELDQCAEWFLLGYNLTDANADEEVAFLSLEVEHSGAEDDELVCEFCGEHGFPSGMMSFDYTLPEAGAVSN
jgi:hypothetical protein